MSAGPSESPMWLRSICLWSCPLVCVCDLEDRGRKTRPGVGGGHCAFSTQLRWGQQPTPPTRHFLPESVPPLAGGWRRAWVGVFSLHLRRTDPRWPGLNTQINPHSSPIAALTPPIS